MPQPSLIQFLTYLGAVPFYLALYLVITNQVLLGISGGHWFKTYGLVILSFMAGTIWGQVVNASVRVKRLVLASNAVTLLAWFAYLLVSTQATLVIMATGFVALYILEALIMTHVTRPDYYLGLRLRVSALVLLAHGVMLYML
ncbi:DUF3429 domain-containing protein [Bermanella sp. WJH001]|uniref:DUF3429 domain-containing protein n=1 Tax=Bermanella sp. WJH001 TaxID=3048005 RepID=UPI0024BE016E|nr:DUF3429 domain-containing protein [Bermanella sp. WJH001]MDJ1539700.1 DUF3429 domain-containing protein [Bermanella sp. WJH001]